jgi:hypothetical protein
MEEAGFQQRFFERVCRRRGALTIAFVLAGLLFFVSVAIVVLADVSRGSQVIAVVDAAVSGVVLLASGALLRACNRFQRRSEATGGRRDRGT